MRLLASALGRGTSPSREGSQRCWVAVPVSPEHYVKKGGKPSAPPTLPSLRQAEYKRPAVFQGREVVSRDFCAQAHLKEHCFDSLFTV